MTRPSPTSSAPRHQSSHQRRTLLLQLGLAAAVALGAVPPYGGWTGRTPFEVRSMRVWARDFDLEFTGKVDPQAAATDSYAMEAWTYLQSTRLREYGSSELDKLTPRITAVQVAADERRVRLTVEPLTPGHVHELRLPGVRNQAGQTLVHPISWYTLNALPKTATEFASTRAVSALSPSPHHPAPLHP